MRKTKAIKNDGQWFRRHQTWIILNTPAMVMCAMLVYSTPLWKELTFYSGYFAVALLVVIFSLNPLQSFVPTSVFIKKMNRYRRPIGVAVFTYVAVHSLCFLIKRNFDWGATFKFRGCTR